MSDQIMFKRLEAYEFAIAEYEKALQSAFPKGATGDVFHHWNAARKHGGRPYLTYEQKERAEMDADMRELQSTMKRYENAYEFVCEERDAIAKDADKAHELLRWAETEMRYAGWGTRLNDQHGRTDLYEAIVEFLK